MDVRERAVVDGNDNSGTQVDAIGVKEIVEASKVGYLAATVTDASGESRQIKYPP